MFSFEVLRIQGSPYDIFQVNYVIHENKFNSLTKVIKSNKSQKFKVR